MYSQEINFTTTKPETTVEYEPVLKQISDFNMQENTVNTQELSALGIGKVNSFFEHINIKDSTQSTFQEETPPNPKIVSSNTDTHKPPTQTIAEQSTPVTENAVEENHTVLMELDVSSIAHMQTQISDYYAKDTNIKRVIEERLLAHKTLQDRLQEKMLFVLDRFAKKPVDQFESDVDQQLKEHDFNKEEIKDYWQWRIQQNTDTDTKASFVRTKNGDQVICNDFVTDQYVSKYRKAHIPTINSDFHNSLKTTEDIESDITQAMQELSPTSDADIKKH